MINRRITVSAMSIVTALSLMTGATFAYFSDTATASNNTFTTGSADLQVALNTESGAGTFGDVITGPNFAGILPGETREFYFWLKNNSSAAIGLDLTADVTAIAPPDDGTQEIDNTLSVNWTCDTDGDNSLGNNTPTSSFSPRDWFNGGNASLGNLTPGEQMFCRMSGNLPTSADNTVAGETVAFDVKYDATQTP